MATSAMSTSRRKMQDPLSKKVPENPKFRHVRPTIDTGSSVTKYMQKLEKIKENYKFRKDEIFKRMKCSTFVQLVIQVARVHQKDAELASIADNDTIVPESEMELNSERVSPVPSLALTEGDFNGEAPPDTGRSTLLSVARGIGELDMNKANGSGAVFRMPSEDDLPYLLLDVRTPDDFEQCHIIGAKSYPKSTLSRTCNYESKDMLAYKNRHGRIIIVYDDDERLGVAPQCVTTLVERGYDNIFMLSGGMKVAARLFPEGLITGSLPSWLNQEQPDPRKKKVKAAEQVLQKASQFHFEPEDIDKLELYLETVLQDHSIGSRMSKASTTASSRMNSSRSAASTGSERPAFR